MSGPAEPAVTALVAHARNVPSETRERFADEAARLAAEPGAILLRTCHRAELYVAGGASTPLGLPALPPGGRRLEGRAAVRHLLSVAAGLDSVVVGEDQILHQLRACFAGRHLAGCVSFDREAAAGPAAARPDGGGQECAPDRPDRLDPLLERLFQLALRVGRETRSWREGRPRSLADIALDEAERRTLPLAGATVLVVGAGKMGRLAALGAAQRGATVLVLNRSHDRAAALAADVAGRAPALAPGQPLPACDAIVVAIAGRWELGGAALSSLLESPAPVLDLSSPPALGADIRAALAARYVSIDDLARAGPDVVRDRLRRRCARLLDDAEAEFLQWLAARSAVPAIQALTDRAESRRAAELDRLFRRLDLEPHDRALVEQMSHRLVASILHAPVATLREDADGDLERAARALFSL